MGVDINSICLSDYMNQQVRLDHLSIQFLVEKGIDVNKKCSDKLTPLHLAIQKEDLKMIKYLIVNGADPNAIKAHRYAKKNTTSQPVIDFFERKKRVMPFECKSPSFLHPKRCCFW